ncbi:MAG: hypothetical protein IKC52_01930 [Clostridia bacterium]|nr:hypothetical protein [Clostridia bacterium]
MEKQKRIEQLKSRSTKTMVALFACLMILLLVSLMLAIWQQFVVGAIITIAVSTLLDVGAILLVHFHTKKQIQAIMDETQQL